MIAKIKTFLRWLFAIEAPSANRRTPGAAHMLQQASLRAIQASASGAISCPWEIDEAAQCEYDRTLKTFHCRSCHRNGNIETLLRRLDARGVYEERVV